MGGLIMVILSPLCAVAGFVFKLFVDTFSKHQTMLKRSKIKDIEY